MNKMNPLNGPLLVSNPKLALDLILIKFLGSLILTSLLFINNAYADIEIGNWNPQSRLKINKLLKNNAFKNKKVIFDFDNTTVSRDIGEATFAYLVKNNIVKNDEKLKVISPSFTLDNKLVSLDSVVDLTEYYEKLTNSTQHESDKSPYIISYGWIVQAMQGLTIADVIDATKGAYNENIASKDREKNLESKIEVTEGKTSYRVPFFHDETVDLIGNLILNGYDVYFISGSNSWTIRYMTTIALPKLLKEKFKKDLKIKPENVLGVNTLIKDKRTGKLYKDYFLTKENKKYAQFDQEEIKNYEITNQLVSPLTGFDGKTINAMSYICKYGEKPFLVLGDSSGDYSLLRFAENRIWFARMESYEYQSKVMKIINETDKKKWIIQPVLYKKSAGLVKDKKQLKLLVKDDQKHAEFYKTIKLFTDKGILKY